MRLYVFVLFTIFFTKCHAQQLKAADSLENKSCRMHDFAFAVKTDMLAIFNSAVDPAENEILISGELSFNNMHGVQLNIHLSKERLDISSRSAYAIGAEYIYYIENYDYTGWNTGAYITIQRSTVSIDHRLLEDRFIRYKESEFEAGLSGGYRLILYKHLLINPVGQLGVTMTFGLHIEDSLNDSYSGSPEGMKANIFLKLGYLF